MFKIIRFIFAIIVFLVCYLIIRKSRIINKRRCYTIVLVVAIIVLIISGHIPIENAFITFPSAESAFLYSENTKKIKLVVDGENSSLVIADNGNADLYKIIPKSNGGWKIDLGVNTKNVNSKIYDGNVINVYQYKDSSDYYITVLNLSFNELEVSDNRNSEFYCLDPINTIIKKTGYEYYAYVNDIDDQYMLTINGNNISVTFE